MSVTLEHAVNNAIRTKEVRLVDGAGNQLGVKSTSEAIAEAQRQGLDLVAISPNANPPVCRILDYSKFKYDLQKAEKERLKKARENQVDTKEIQLRPVTDDHDIGIKAKRARGFLDDGDRVKVVVKFRGRELSHKEMGRTILDTFLAQVGEHKVEQNIQMSDRQMFTVLSPLKRSNS